MRLLVLLLLALVSARGFPERRAEKTQALQARKEPKVREVQRDCKGKCATSIAQKAAAEAKAAQAAQNAAGAQAAHMVKTQLAEKALQAAKAAEAALAGKQAVVEQLQQEVKEAEAVVAENTAAVHQQQGTVNAAVEAAQQATAQHKLLVQATQLAAQLEKSVHCVLEKTKYGLQEKCHNLSEARARLAQLQHKLQCACAECSATKQAAHCACEAARAACGNARRKKHIIKHNAIASKQDKQGR
ncbi:uncharacterized protein LOC114243917 [Bombyx mandarina]|uniref:Uncharacterized protein n=2 Tax=Bombyx TaxID=7090 RepID=A0A8R2AIT2_BOMMO|nr:tol-Pal system protein TolA isoform X1 [Bombyx mori]XP_028031369.1 uncharacterized protein LOC114243917 [Bombyx mandarina]